MRDFHTLTAKLEELAVDLEEDIQKCTTREQHIRAVQRLSTVQTVIRSTREMNEDG